MTNPPHQSSIETSEGTVRLSVTLPKGEYAELERIAKNQRVSLAWVVREAVHTYLADKWPLLDSSTPLASIDIEER